MNPADRQRRAARLLSRGGRILGLAAVAYARGQRAGTGPWYALPAETVAAVEEVLLVLENEEDPELLEAVVCAALSPEPSTAAPSWAEPLWRDPAALTEVGRAVDDELTKPVLGSGEANPPPRLKGMAALAMALCRSPDGLAALAARLPGDEGPEVVRLACLAGAEPMGRIVKARELRSGELGILRGADEIAGELVAAATESARLRCSAEHEIIDLALEVARRLVNRAVELEPGLLDDCYRRALDGVGPAPGATVSVHPEDRSGSGIDDMAREAGIEVVEDPGVGRGGCRVRAGALTVDATLEGMLARLEAELKDG